MQEARQAFAEFGSDLPMDELARRAGVGVGTVYRHFPNKEALLDGLLAEQLGVIVGRTRAALERDQAWEAFCDLVREGTAMQAEDLAFCEIVMARKHESESQAVAELRETMDAEMTELLSRAKAQGRLRSDFGVEDVGLLFASLAGAVRASGGGDGWKRQVEFALDGLRA